jgi:monofunctional biosynthetic peptidoglycan transglycosylase
LTTPGRRLLRLILLIGLGVPLGLVCLYRFVPPPLTPLMVIRLFQGEGLDKDWVPLSAISPELQRAVMASEDAKFCTHHGFDWAAIDNAMDVYEDGGHVLGASTISMQTAKNLFLWPGRDFLRKGIEAMLTVMLETVWPKRRIMEVYLNIIEWGPGIYGAEAAARHYYRKPAAQLTQREAAALAAVLPSPRRWSPIAPGGHVASRIPVISARMSAVPMHDGRICR